MSCAHGVIGPTGRQLRVIRLAIRGETGIYISPVSFDLGVSHQYYIYIADRKEEFLETLLLFI